MKLYSKEEIARKFGLLVQHRFKRGVNAAAHYNVKPPYITAVSKGNKPPNKQMMEDLGFVKTIAYIKVTK